MKGNIITNPWIAILSAGLLLTLAINSSAGDNPVAQPILSGADPKLKSEVFKILDSKCNVCHRKKNPFMVFNEKNMVKRAKKIHKMVFVERRMPKGDEIRLSNEEYNTIEQWLFTQNIY
jgi:uncharacterized membrane protein